MASINLMLLMFSFVCFVISAILNRNAPASLLLSAGLACYVAAQLFR